MMNIQSVLEKYSSKIDHLDLDLLIATAIKKPREFVLAHPEYKLKKAQSSKLKTQILRRIKHEPLAYILGQKEFYGLEFKVDKNTLIPRPETEQLVELASQNIKHTTGTRLDSRRPLVDARRDKKNKLIVADIGTGSGNIIISLVKNLINSPSIIRHSSFYAIDISSKALEIAKQNAKFHKVNKKINFLHGNLLEPILKVKSQKSKVKSYIIIANLPYLSEKIYNSAPKDVKNYEPKSALLSGHNGLDHYKKLFHQLKKLKTTNHQLQTFIEFSPEQKNQLKKAVATAFPQCSIAFFKDLAGKFRIIQIKL